MSVSVLCLFLTVPWVGLQCVIVAFPSHTHFVFTALFQSINQLQKDIDEIQQQMEDNEKMKMNLTRDLLFTKGK